MSHETLKINGLEFELSHEGVYRVWGRLTRLVERPLINAAGEVQSGCINFPMDQLSDIYQAWVHWKEQHPKDEPVCEGWELRCGRRTGLWTAHGPDDLRVFIGFIGGTGEAVVRVRNSAGLSTRLPIGIPLKVIEALREWTVH